MKFRLLVFRALRLRCAFCGQGRLFESWFGMHKNCPHCGVKFEREAGFFLGSIYFNYGLTALIVAIAYPVLLFSKTAGEGTLLAGCFAFTLLFPMWFHRYARALWLGFDQFMDPRDRTDAIGAPPLDTQKLDVDTRVDRGAVDVETTVEASQAEETHRPAAATGNQSRDRN